MIVWKLKPLNQMSEEGGNPISLTPVDWYNYGHNRQPTITIYLLCWAAFNLIILSGNIFIFNAPLSDFGAYASSFHVRQQTTLGSGNHIPSVMSAVLFLLYLFYLVELNQYSHIIYIEIIYG